MKWWQWTAIGLGGAAALVAISGGKRAAKKRESLLLESCDLVPLSAERFSSRLTYERVIRALACGDLSARSSVAIEAARRDDVEGKLLVAASTPFDAATSEVWDTITALVKRARNEVSNPERVLNAANTLLSGWPDEAREVEEWEDISILARQVEINRKPSSFLGRLAFRSIVHSPRVENLTSFDLFMSPLTSTGVQTIVDSPYLKNLTSLRLEMVRMDDAGARDVANSPYLSNLTELTLEANQISDSGAMALANSPYIKHLTRLNLSWNQIRGPGAAALAASENLTGLESLDLLANRIGDTGALAILHSPMLKNLKTLVLMEDFSDEVTAALTERFPGHTFTIH